MQYFGELNKCLKEIRDKAVWDWFTTKSYFYKFVKEDKMKKLHVTCDYCNKEIDNFNVWITVKLNDNVNHEYHFHDRRCLRRWAKNE
ncbi:MAG: hypothetical protein DRI65_06645 [Chloroflexota bacterium]|nr:MAG: hypothetical protein DRI65_06645 [Chloroflexota bacterium]